MKSPAWALLTYLLCARPALGAIPLSSIKKETNLPTVPNKFIVEVDDLSALPDKRFLEVSPLDFLYHSLQKRAVGFEVNKEYNSKGLFVGAALTLVDGKDIVTLQNTPGVKAIRPVRKFSRPSPVKTHVVTDANDPAIPPDIESTHILTGVDKLHAEGITGKGVKIGIIDTGVDYTHPALGGGFGPGHKIVGGFDLVGDNYDGTNDPVPDDDPLDQCVGHGTHVSGIIGADPDKNPFNISGVAYDASLSMYRVFGCVGFVTDDVLVDALLLGVKDGQDILTLSLGGADGWTESSSAVVASRIAASGKVITIAAGNDGASGSWYSSSPGNGIDVISVASLDKQVYLYWHTVIPLQNATVGGVAHDPITYFSTFPLPVNQTLPIFATSNDTTVVDDACNPLPASIPDLSGFVVIIRRGTCTFVQKLTNVAAKGGKVALIYDNGSGFGPISVGDFTATLIQAADGEFLVQEFAAGVPVTLTFPQSGGSTQFPDPAGGLISSFSSYGPSNDFFFKPAVAAPGGNILSTLPFNSYGVESGTSMATPFVAGCAALLFSVKGTGIAVGRGARTLFETTAQVVPSTHTDGDPLQTVTQQGAGLINAFNAIHAGTIVSPGELILNDTTHFKGSQSITISNTGTTAKTYTLRHVPAGTAVTVTPGTIFVSEGPVPLTTTSLSVSLSSTVVTVRPGQTQTVSVRFTLPRGDASTFPVYSGFVQITSGSEQYHVSYVGLGAALKDKQIIDNTDVFFGIPLPTVINGVGDIQEGPTNYTFVGGDFPTVIVRLTFGTPVLRLDLVSADFKLQAALQSRATNSHPLLTFPSKHRAGSFSQVETIGPILEADFISRNNDDPNDNGFYAIGLVTPTFANGTQIRNGSYRLLTRVLRVTGDPNREEDYEAFVSPIIGIIAA